MPSFKFAKRPLEKAANIGLGGTARCGRRCPLRSLESGSTGHLSTSVIVVLSSGLQQIHRNSRQFGKVSTRDDRTSDQDDKEDKHCEVKDREANNSFLSELRLFQRVNRRANLATAMG
jgi:hypothetical protein